MVVYIPGTELISSAIKLFSISDIVYSLQVETVAQFGVVFLLFALGLEFSMTKV